MLSNSWIITRRKTSAVIGEFYDPHTVAKFNSATCLIETAYDYLCRLNRHVRADAQEYDRYLQGWQDPRD